MDICIVVLVNVGPNLKCYSQILCGGFVYRIHDLLKNLDLVYFVLIWWQTDRKPRNPEAELQGPVYLDKTTNCLINCML